MRRSTRVALLLALAACSKSNSGGTGPGPTGSLDITITAPGGVSARVNVITPSDSIITITSSQTVNGLAPGNYVVRAAAGVTNDPIVSTAYAGAVTGSPANVTAGQTANATVTYTSPRASSGMLWVANRVAYTIAGFSSANLGATGAPTPAVSIGNGTASSIIQGTASIAVDSSGGIWFVDTSDTLFYYAASAITANTNAAATRRLVSTTLTNPIALAFDPRGDLWAADESNNTLNEFTPAQLAAGGTETPSVILHASLGSIDTPSQIAFDAKGDLWVCNTANSSVVGFSPSQYASSGQPLPFAGITGTQAIAVSQAIAFDAQGNLWVATALDTLAKFTPDQLTSVGSPTPSVVITLPSVTFPNAIAFDNSGSLWVAGYVSNKLIKFTSSQLNATGAPSPTVTISPHAGSITLPSGITFSPAAKDLPVN